MKKHKLNLSKIDLTRLNYKKITIPLAFLILASLSYYAPERSQQIKLTSSYPATVCPAIGDKVSASSTVLAELVS